MQVTNNTHGIDHTSNCEEEWANNNFSMDIVEKIKTQ